MAEKLVRMGASIHLQDKDGKTALMWASACEHGEVAEKLVRMGASIHLQDKNGKTALIPSR